MNHDKKRYYIMIALAFVFAIVGAYLLNSDRAISAILFNSVLASIPIMLVFLFIDYTLTLIGRHTLMKYYYFAVLLAYILTIAESSTQAPSLAIIQGIIVGLLGIATIVIIGLFFRYAFIAGHEELQTNTPHVMDKLADAYQKQKANPKSWEEQSFDFFASKLGRIRKNAAEEEKVSV